MRIDFSFAPGSPWGWITSRWLVEVQQQRDLDVHWRTCSLLEKNRELIPPDQREGAQAGDNMLRVAEALRVAAGEEAVGVFYREFGARVHHDSTPVRP